MCHVEMVEWRQKRDIRVWRTDGVPQYAHQRTKNSRPPIFPIGSGGETELGIFKCESAIGS